ncbi:acetate operon repressor [Clostridium acetireducens DSM 10703]|uniref:Glycerol operon regulatory protein n=1 Tax=Clostridium acetireducens DSM 10703 TaxID=1121290 RepID=A0A1E8EYA5_9CLOT|nr:IclR family transcriptional regulator [Clostridium acetireducens]OFI05506.1 acetate operon repressor [Clostridium acetireducens DSM 10703]
MSEIIISVDRAIDILLALYNNGKEMGVSDIARELDLYKSTVHRSLATLENKGFVYQNKDNGKYWLGIKIYAMGLLIGEKLSLIDLIKPYAKELFEEFQEVVNVSILDKSSRNGYKSIIILKEVDTKKVLSVNPNIGSSSDIHVSAVGKCLLAFSKDINFEKLSHKSLKKYTENTLTNWDDLLNEIKKVRENGYAIDNEEQEIGLTCIGAPILDKYGNSIAAISISGPTSRIIKEDLDFKISKLVKTAKKISMVIKEINWEEGIK